MKKLRILALVHDHLVPPEDTTGIDILEAEWKMEYDVIETLREIGHEVRVLGINDDLGGIRPTVGLFKPHIVFNLMEAFAGVTTFDQNVVSYLELLGSPTPGAIRAASSSRATRHSRRSCSRITVFVFPSSRWFVRAARWRFPSG